MSIHTQRFYYKNNRLQQLRGFCFAAQFLNITKAAKHMGISASSVSIQIKSLEGELGVKLLTREGPRIKLTTDGKMFFKLALPYVEGINQLYNQFHEELKHQEKTELNIAANSTTIHYLLPNITKHYLESKPNTYINIYFSEQNEAIERLKQEESDIALLPFRKHLPLPKGIEYIPLFYYTPSLITRSDHPLAGRRNLTVQDISRYELTLPAEDLRVIPDLYDVFSDHGINKKMRINLDNAETGRNFIETGQVITISSTVWMKETDVLVATPLDHLFEQINYGVMIKRKKIYSDKINHFIEIAKQLKNNIH